jgi:hypothetical protein
MSPQSQFPSKTLLTKWFLAAVLAVALCVPSLTGCSKLAYRTKYYSEAAPMAYKRIPRHETVDLVHRWRAKAFSALKPDPASVSADEEKTLKEFGPPDYVRRFRAKSGEKTTEWVYLDNDLLVQYVGGDLAYSGPVTDIEKLLIDRGYPDGISRTTQAQGPEHVDFFYWNWCHTTCKAYSFSDGYLVEMQE